MGLFRFFARRDAGATPAGSQAMQRVHEARVRARRRLIGATVLLAAGVVGLPLVFETQPRPLPVDIAVEIPKRDAIEPLAVPSARVASGVAQNAKEPASAVPLPARTQPEPVARASAAAAGAASAAPAASAAAVAPRASAAKAAEPPKARFVVQVGAFADAGGASQARARVDKLGLKTYTQAVETGAGLRTRVRAGPYETREEADRAAARIKAAGLPAAVLSL